MHEPQTHVRGQLEYQSQHQSSQKQLPLQSQHHMPSQPHQSQTVGGLTQHQLETIQPHREQQEHRQIPRRSIQYQPMHLPSQQPQPLMQLPQHQPERQQSQSPTRIAPAGRWSVPRIGVGRSVSPLVNPRGSDAARKLLSPQKPSPQHPASGPPNRWQEPFAASAGVSGQPPPRSISFGAPPGGSAGSRLPSRMRFSPTAPQLHGQVQHSTTPTRSLSPMCWRGAGAAAPKTVSRI